MKQLDVDSDDNVWTRLQNLEADKDEKGRDQEIVFWKIGNSVAIFAKQMEDCYEIFEMNQDLEDDVNLRFNDEDLNHIKTVEGSRSDWEALEEVVNIIRTEKKGVIIPQKASDLKQVGVVEKGKILKKELGYSFPDQKFSVTTDKYTGGSSITVSWEDGVAEEDVQEVTDMYQYTYPDQDTQSGYHHVDNHVFTKRDISDEAKESVASEILEKFADDVFSDDYWRDNRFQEEYNQVVKKTSFDEKSQPVEVQV